MGVPLEQGGMDDRRKMEGWLYLVRSNRFGLQTSRKRYFILENNTLNCYKAVPSSEREEPIKSAFIDSCIRVMDDGRESQHRNVFYLFTLYDASNHTDQLKLGARSSEEAAKWIQSLKEAALKECTIQEEDPGSSSKRRSQYFKLTRGRSRTQSIDWTGFSAITMDPTTFDVIAPSTWAIIGCQNGLRLFKEARDADSAKPSDDPPAIMAVGVVDATSEVTFQTVMSLGPSRSEWDFCLQDGSVVECLDGHTDIIHKKLRTDWFPWGMKRRDLLLQRYWRREDDGTYVILYHSVFHPKYQPDRSYIRACIKSGGYVITPVDQGKRSLVKHMLAVDWKFWKSYLIISSARQVTMHMLVRVAALREFFRAKHGTCSCSDFSSGELTKEMMLPQGEKEEIKLEVELRVETCKTSKTDNSLEEQRSPTKLADMGGSILALDDAADEFFDVINESDYDQTDSLLSSDATMQSQYDQQNSSLSTAATFVKKLHDIAVQTTGFIDLQETPEENSSSCVYGTTLPNDPTCSIAGTWAMADPSTFLIRSESYLFDQQKIEADSTLMQMVAADWLRSDKREDDLGGRPGGIVQNYAAKGGSEFFVIVNIQVPGSTAYSLALYYMMDKPLQEVPLLESFVKGDDAYRNSRFKLIPYISQGSWIVKQSVGKKSCLVGQALEINYSRGSNYIELDVDVGSSTVARGVVSLVLGYLNNLVVEMAFLVQSNTQEELPEVLLGTCRLNHLDASKAFAISPFKC